MLVDRGHEVAGIDAGYFREDGGDPEGHERTETFMIDVRRAGPDVFRGIDAVVHLAALSNDPMGQLRPELTDRINHRATRRLAEMARDSGVGRFVFSSSCSLYGAANTSAPLDESAPMNPVTAYARSKVDSEKTLSTLATDGFSPVFLRNATAYGLSPAMRFDLVVNNLVGWALTTGSIRLESDGTPWRPLVHVEDIARACAAALEAPQEAIHNQAINIGRSDQNFQVRQIAEVVGRAVPGCAVQVAPSAGPDTRSYRVSFDKAARVLPGFQPSWTPERGVEQMVDYFRRRGLTDEEFRGRPYVRLAQLRHLIDTSQVDSELYWTAGVPQR